jgi:predicted nuclease with TOPRIM domain
MTASSDKTRALELENERLQAELAECRQEFKDVKNQVSKCFSLGCLLVSQEVTIRRLEDRLKDLEERVPRTLCLCF